MVSRSKHTAPTHNIDKSSRSSAVSPQSSPSTSISIPPNVATKRSETKPVSEAKPKNSMVFSPDLETQAVSNKAQSYVDRMLQEVNDPTTPVATNAKLPVQTSGTAQRTVMNSKPRSHKNSIDPAVAATADQAAKNAKFIKRKRLASDAEPVAETKPALKKQKRTTKEKNTRANGDVTEAGSTKAAAKTAIIKAPVRGKTAAEEYNLLVKREEAKFRRDAAKGALAQGQFKRSFNDTMSASRMSRAHTTDVTTMIQPPMSLITNRNAEHKVPLYKAPEKFDIEQNIKEPPPSPYITNDRENAGFKIINVRKVKYIRTGANNTTLAKLENIVKAPELYPNIELTYDDKGHPIEARMTTLNVEQWEVATSAGKHSAKTRKTQTTNGKRKTAKKGQGQAKTVRVTNAKTTRRPHA